MVDEPRRITAEERNSRRIVRIMVKHFPDGVTTEDLRRQFEEETGRKRQTFYEALSYARKRQWIVDGGANGVPCGLNSNGCWNEVLTTLEKPPYKRDHGGRNFLKRMESGAIRSFDALISEAIAHVDQGRPKRD